MITKVFYRALLIIGLFLAGAGVQAEVILQYFQMPWRSMTQKMPELAEAGYTALWLPPPTKASGGLSDLIDIAHEAGMGGWNHNFGPTEGSHHPGISFVRHPENPEYYDFDPNGDYIGFGNVTQEMLDNNPGAYTENVNAYPMRAVRLKDAPLRDSLNGFLGAPWGDLSGMDQPGFSGHPAFNQRTGVSFPHSHDSDFASARELQYAYIMTREGLPIVYTDGYFKAGTLQDSGGAFPRHANTNFLGQFADRQLPNLAYIREHFARGGQLPIGRTMMWWRIRGSTSETRAGISVPSAMATGSRCCS